uniref:60S ribosomal export protein NMD3 n=1 Tax=Oryza nivara TaxID=4536 RepID=A0A0E0FZ10_ORYNI
MTASRSPRISPNPCRHDPDVHRSRRWCSSQLRCRRGRRRRRCNSACSSSLPGRSRPPPRARPSAAPAASPWRPTRPTRALCIRSRVDIAAGVPRHADVVHCPSCSSYLHPPRLWLRAAPESPELMSLLLRRVDRHIARLGVALAAAEFVFTEPHSRRLMLRLRLRGEVLHGSGGGVTLEQGHVVEFAVHDRLCDACAMVRARAAEPPDQCGWSAVVQVRQRASHRRTLLHLEQQVVAAGDALRVGAAAVAGSTSSSRRAPTPPASSTSSPRCRPPASSRTTREASRDLGGLGPIVLCVMVTNALALLDTSTLRVVHLGIKEYDKCRLEPALTSRQLVEYVVLDVDHEPEPAAGVAYAQVARASDLGKNDTIFTVRTHLGHVLNAGHRALGDDLYGANVNNHDVESHGLPDAVLVMKINKKGSTRRQLQDGDGCRRRKRDGDEMEEIAMGIGCIDLNPPDEKELDELLRGPHNLRASAVTSPCLCQAHMSPHVSDNGTMKSTTEDLNPI